MIRSTLAVLMLALAGQNVSDTPAALPSVTLSPRLDRVLRDYERAWRAGDVAALAAMCDLVIADGPVPVQAEPVVLSVRHSASFGDTLTAGLPAESRIRVVSVVNVGKVEPQTLRITLNTSEAVAGEYELIVGDGQAECMGTIRVTSQPSDR